MKIFTWNDILKSLDTGSNDSFFKERCGISVGSFDGLHLGHRKLLSTLIEDCNKNHLKKGVVSFSRPLPSLKHSKDYSGYISSL